MKKHTFVILAHNESDDLEECIKSVLKQSVKSNVLIATSTPNDYIIDLASDYSLGVMVNSEEGKGSDYNFAINTYDSELVTIAHQDDIYDRNYTKEILKCFNNNSDATIIFTDNYEIIGDKKKLNGKELNKKRRKLWPLKYHCFQKNKFFKLRCLKNEKYICTSSITFVKKNIEKELFPTDLIYNNDWKGLIDLAQKKSKFVYIDKKLVGFRVVKKAFNKEKFMEDVEILKSLYPSWMIDIIIKKRIKNN